MNLLSNEEVHTVKVTTDHKKAAIDFISTLFNGTLNDYWGSLCDVDQMAILTSYGFMRNSGMKDSPDFEGYLSKFREEFRSKYSSVKEDCNVFQTVYYTSSGEVILYLFQNSGNVRLIAPTPEACRLRLGLTMLYDAETNKYNGYWKVRLIEPNFKNIQM